MVLSFAMKFTVRMLKYSVKWVLCHNGMACPQAEDGANGLQMWTVAANILDEQSRAADKGWSSSLGVGRGPNNKIIFLRNVAKGLGL
jgi:hypothetical protein